ncbi:MAG: phosphotransferase [Alphaproteobacteria bacterium]
MKIRKLQNHGRETYAVYYGDGFVLKRPLPNFGEEAQERWLTKQHKTKRSIDEIHAVGNPIYNIPRMVYINDDEYQVLEERALGEPLTKELYRTLTRRQQFEIVNGLSSFLVDMNELKPTKEVVNHKITSEIKFPRFENFVESKMSDWFEINDVRYMIKVKNQINQFEYKTMKAWSHGDLNAGNVLYNKDTSKLSFIDFAEANYEFIYRDIFAPLQIELDICKSVYEIYKKFHVQRKYKMPGLDSSELQTIMKNRIIIVLLKRFIKASDDLRPNTETEKGTKNNLEKVKFMQNLIQSFQNLDRKFSK